MKNDQCFASLFQQGERSRWQMDSLDGVRGLAVMGVLFAHAQAYGWRLLPGFDASEMGKPGVFLFFSLSAFLLTLPIYHSEPEQTCRLSYWGRYWWRRLLRIYPLYFCVLLVLFVVQPLIEGDPLDQAFPSILRHLLLLDGFRHLWTIAVETKFYFLLPFVALGLRALASRWWAQCAVTVAAIFTVAWCFPAEAAPHDSVNTGYYLPVFLLGCFAAVVFSRRSDSPATERARFLAEVLSWASLALALALTQPWLTQPLGWRGDRAFIFWGALWAIFLVAHLIGAGTCRRLFSCRPLRFLGMISYSAYLWHPIILQCMKKLKGLPSPVGWVIFIVVTLVVATASYLVVERPLAHLGRRKSSPPLETTSASPVPAT